MSCWKPNGDCTTPGNCGPAGGGCGCDDGCGGVAVESPCASVTLENGTFPNAVVAVQNGCIVAVTSGAPFQYTPNDCCGDTPAGGGGPVIVEQGPPGADGQSATVTVAPIVAGSGSQWAVQNVGTSSAAVLQFTSPAPVTGALTGVATTKDGSHATKFTFTVAVDPVGLATITLNLDGLYDDLAGQISALQSDFDDYVAAHP